MSARDRIDFAYIKEHADFLTVLRHYDLKVEGRGTQRSVLCPFHPDKRPSCKVNLGRRSWHCFGCARSGNVLEFVALMEDVGLDPEEGLRQAARKLAEICAIDLAHEKASRRLQAPRSARKRPETTKEPSGRKSAPREPPGASGGPTDEPAGNEPLSADFIERFEAKLVRDHPSLSERGLTPELVAAFGLGYYPDEPKRMMRNRIVIPIRNVEGRLLAYAGRWVGPEEDIPEGKGKYELPAGFRKELELYNLERVTAHRHLVVVEGYFSVVRLHAVGVPAVALMGHSFSARQLELLERCGVARLTFLLDGDRAGREAVPAIMERLARSPIFAKFAVLPEGTQPDTLDRPTLDALIGR